MNQEKQRIAIAEACGWTNSAEKPYQVWVHPDKPSCNTPTGSPSYLTDLNAMHEAEKVLDGIAGGWSLYTDLLEGGIVATAAQRAEAFLRTIGKWEGEE